MADSFSDLNLFSEFERTPEPADKILMSKYNVDLKKDFTDDDSARDEFEEDGGEPDTVDSSEPDLHDRKVAEIVDGENPMSESKTRKSTRSQSHHTSSDKSSAAEIAKLKAELSKLRKDYERLKRHSRLISTSKCGKLDEGPVIQVVYMNNVISRKSRGMIETVLSQLIYDYCHKDITKYQEKHIAPSSLCLDEDEEDTPVPEEKIRQIKTSTVIGCSQMYQQFIIDTMGWPLIDNNPIASEGWDSPKYRQVFNVSLGDGEDDEKENSCPQKIRRFSCFNCNGDHNMKDCKEPYNSAKVAQNRQKFRNENPALQKQNSRYHVNDPKFSKFKPGHISEELRKAMGLADDQLPLYIYNMRRLGYPPGHLQALTDNCSGIAMFGKDGREIALNGEPVEEGEVEAALPVNYNIDLTRIIDYPGFNVPVKNGEKDESKMLGKNEISSRQSKEMMAEQLAQKNRGIKRRSDGIDMPSIKRNKTEHEPVDMELADIENIVLQSLVPTEVTGQPSLPSEQITQLQLPPEQITQLPLPLEQTTQLSLPPEQTMPPLLPPEETTPPPLPPEAGKPPPLPPEQASSPALPSSKVTMSLQKTTVSPEEQENSNHMEELFKNESLIMLSTSEMLDTPDSPNTNESTVESQPKLVPLEKQNWMASYATFTMPQVMRPVIEQQQLYHGKTFIWTVPLELTQSKTDIAFYVYPFCKFCSLVII